MDRSSRARHALAISSLGELDGLHAETAWLVRWLAPDCAWPRRRRTRSGSLRLLALPVVLLARWATWLATRYLGRRARTRTNAAEAGACEAAGQMVQIEVAARKLRRDTESLPASIARLQPLLARIEAVAAQLRHSPVVLPEHGALYRLVREELPELLHSYRRLPPPLTTRAAQGEVSPELQLGEALALVERGLTRLQEGLAQQQLRAFSVQLRYLTLKYAPDGELTAQTDVQVKRG